MTTRHHWVHATGWAHLALVGLVLLLGLPLATASAAARAADGTPSAGEKKEAADEGRLQEMLERAPTIPLGADVLLLATYADVAAQIAAVGVVQPRGPQDESFGEWARATLPLALPSAIVQHARDPLWRETFGFDLFQVDQSLEVGEPPLVTTFLRGRFDERELRAAWEHSGYQAVDVDGTTAASLFEGPEIDLDSDVSRLALARLNNAAILDDGTLVFASSLDAIREVLRVASGDEPSLASRPGVAELLDAVSPLASALLVDGSALAGTAPLETLIGADGDVDAAATAIAAQIAESGRMPPVRLALLGATPGGPIPTRLDGVEAPAPPADQARLRFQLALLMADADAAATAVPVVEERLRTGQSLVSRRTYAELFPVAEQRVEAIEGTPVLLVDLGLGDETPINIWVQMLFTRDLAFVGW